MSLLRFLPSLGALVFVAGVSSPLPVQAQQSTLRCESESHQTRYCDADTRGGVRLIRQLSHAGCWQNDTWGYDRRGIWVNHGCRAEFATAGYGWHDDRYERDRNDDTGKKVVAGAVVLGLIGAAILADKHDDDRDDHGGYGYGSITCESQDGHYRRCPANIGRGHVEIERVLSRAECRYGQSWGADRGGVWVDRGCRARFAIR